MGDKPRKKLNQEQALALLPDANWIHVFIDATPGEGEMWSRKRVIEHISKNEPELADNPAVLHRHGIFSGGIYFEMRTTPPASKEHSGGLW